MQQLVQECERQRHNNNNNNDDDDDDNNNNNSNNNNNNIVIIDVRSWPEIAATGKLSPCVQTLPIEVIAQYQVFAMDDDDFADRCGFAKPSRDHTTTTLVFTCAAGVRSVYACHLAAQQGGYTQLINYKGGAYEWFAPIESSSSEKESSS